jgi:class 3 adenylate cyclase
MGSAERLFYTCIGDTVNTAARLKGVNSLFGTALVASAAMRDAATIVTVHSDPRTRPAASGGTDPAVTPEFVWRPLGRVGLVGKSQVLGGTRHAVALRSLTLIDAWL